jgi:hypothetical protein
MIYDGEPLLEPQTSCTTQQITAQRLPGLQIVTVRRDGSQLVAGPAAPMIEATLVETVEG